MASRAGSAPSRWAARPAAACSVSFRDIGKPIVLSLIHQVEQQQGQRLDSASAEQLLEEFHQRAGVRLAEKWALPDWICAVIEFHHDYEHAGEHRIEAMVGCLAGELALWAQDLTHADADEFARMPVCTDLGLGPDDLRKLQDDRKAVLEMAKAYI